MSSDRQARIDQAVAEFRAAQAAGGKPVPGEWAARHPDLAPELGQQLDKLSQSGDINTRTIAAVPDVPLDAARMGRLWNAVLDAGADRPPGVDSADAPGFKKTGGAALSGASRVMPKIDGYEFIRELHRGGQGVVYQALEKATKRKVAIKVLLEGPYASDSARKRFEREIELAASLKHANIVAVYHSGLTPEGRQFCVMDYIRGVAMQDYVREQRLGLEDALRLFMKVCEAVNYAHQRGVIHRDLKPGNILVDSDGEPRVLDFGLAKQVGGPEQTIVSVTGQVFGTLQYMSPEQARGNPDEIDIRTDVYSLGIVLYEVLTGRFPYPVEGQLAEVLRHISATEPMPPSRAWQAESGVSGTGSSRRGSSGATGLAAWMRRRNRPTDHDASPIDDEVQTIVLRALAKDRQRRYQSAADLARDIEHYLKDEPIEAKRDSRLYVLGKQLRKYRLPVAIAAAFVMSLLAGLGGTIWQAKRANERAEAATKAEGEAKAATEKQRQLAESEAEARREADLRTAEAVAARAKVEYNAYTANIEMAAAAMEYRQFDRVRARLAACPPRLRSWEWGWLNASVDNSLVALHGHTNAVSHVAFSPDGKRLVTGSRDHTARTWDAETGACLLVLSGHENAVYSAEFSSDGRLILTGSADGTARVWNAEDGRSIARMAVHVGEINEATFSPDGRRVLTVGEDHTARLWEARSGKSLAEMKGHTEPLNSGAFSPDGAHVLTAAYDGTLLVWDTATGREVCKLNGPTGVVTVDAGSFSPDGTKIVTASAMKSAKELESQMHLWDAATGEHLRELKGHAMGGLTALFSPDGKQVVTTSLDRTARIWDVETGESRATLMGHTGMVFQAHYLPDGSSVITTSEDQTARVWDIKTSVMTSELLGQRGMALWSTLSADGRRFAATSADNAARWWSVGSEANGWKLKGHTGPVRYAAFSPDGETIVTGSDDETARIWNAWTCESVLELTGHADSVMSAMFSPDGRRVVTASSDGTARVWDAERGKSLLILRGHTASVNFATFSPDGAHILTASQDNTARVWDATSGKPVFDIQGQVTDALSAIYSPDGRWIVTAAEGGVARVWDARTGVLSGALKGHRDAVNQAAFSHDGRFIVTASSDKTARIWGAQSREEVRSLNGHTGAVIYAWYSPNDERIVTASADSTARVWDPATGVCVALLKWHSFMHAVDSAMFSPDGTRIVTASRDATARIWDSVPSRVRYRQQWLRRHGLSDAGLITAYLREVRGETPATWLSDPTLATGRPEPIVGTPAP